MRASRLGDLWSGGADLLADRLRGTRPDPSRLVVLTFHRVHSLDAAAAELRRLREVAVPVSLQRVLAANAGDDELPPEAVLVTLDDGHPSVVDAAPVFASLGVPAVCFVVSDLIDTHTPFWWDEIIALTARGASAPGFDGRAGMDLVNDLKRVPDARRREVLLDLRAQVSSPVEVRQLTSDDLRSLEDAGITVGGHSATHPILTQCDDETLEREVGSCRDRLEQLLGSPPRSFAYPGGGVDGRVVDATRRAGWEVAFSWDHRVSPFPFPDLHRISRVKANLGSGRSRLSLLATGRHSSLRHTRSVPVAAK